LYDCTTTNLYEHAAQPEPDPEAFPGGLTDKFVLTEYGDHVARCIYENVVVT
jgi:hypothetical protein